MMSAGRCWALHRAVGNRTQFLENSQKRIPKAAPLKFCIGFKVTKKKFYKSHDTFNDYWPWRGNNNVISVNAMAIFLSKFLENSFDGQTFESTFRSYALLVLEIRSRNLRSFFPHPSKGRLGPSLTCVDISLPLCDILSDAVYDAVM